LANRNDLPGMLAFDKWTCNCDARQLVFHRRSADATEYVATMVDQGFCFNANEWNFPDAPIRGLYSRPAVYQEVTGWESFEPFLSRLQHLDTNGRIVGPAGTTCGTPEEAPGADPGVPTLGKTTISELEGGCPCL
jgi:hypothetical protein